MCVYGARGNKVGHCGHYFLVTMVIHIIDYSSVWRRRGGSWRGGSGGEGSCMDGEWRGKGRRVMEVR